MRRVVVIGANGQLGSDLVEHWGARGDSVVALTHAEIRIEDLDSVRSVLTDAKPDVILNTAAFHNVPKCEEDPGRAYMVNGAGALNVARIAADLGATNVYVSTDYVFDGSKRSPYVETDAPNPLNVYASTKLLGEYYTVNYSPRSYVLRVSGIYGKVPSRAKGGNFITTMLRAAKEKPEVKVVTDEVLTPTPTKAIAYAARQILETGEYGCYHVTCEGECSWFEFASSIFATMKLRTPLLPASVQDFPSSVRRPFYSVLENSKMKRQRIPDMPHWKEALADFLRTTFGAST
jgi:dTDP-4-dehydrorhamnose reductase